MSEYSKGEPRKDLASQYTPEILARAVEVAREILAEAETPVRSFTYGQQSGELYVSRDPALVVGTEVVVVDGETFYIGVFLRA